MTATQTVERAALERRAREIAHELADAYPARRAHPVRALQDLAMARVGADPRLRAALFRLVDVAPACRSRQDLGIHLHHLLLDQVDRSPLPLVTTLARRPVGARAVGVAAQPAVRFLGRRFIVGPDVGAAEATLARLWDAGVAATVDLLGEATVTAVEADSYQRRCDAGLRALARRCAQWPAHPRLERDAAGSMPRANLSIKVTALCANLRPESPETMIAEAGRPLRLLMRTAREAGAHLHVDMESRDSRDAILELVLGLLSEPEFSDGPSVGCVLQAYLVDADEQLDRLLAFAQRRTREPPLTIRLVKGAYWDHESVEAVQRGWPAPVYRVKAESDRSFERLTRRLIDAQPLVRPAIASHNLRSIVHAIAYDELAAGARSNLELQVLRGLGDDLQHALARTGHRVRTYCPVGDLVAGMAYLVRRLLENTSNDSFLAAVAAGADLDRLLEAP